MNINLTIIGQAIAFFIFVVFCMKYVWPPLTSALAERKKKIADGLDAAERAERDLKLAQEKATDNLRESKEQAAAIIEQANKRANQIVDEAKEQAREEANRVKAAAEAEIEQEINQAKEALRAQVAALALAGAEKILEASVDEKAHAQLVEKLAAEL
ncbi:MULTISPECIES: F0F1 ATP synthase subunit B [unclassified Marinobacterium]|uniref:F0F1 ATP synthase subunit B n=1 Tax=unclassified Marinobacterium TaxID=2644139 RepID=UPI000149A113|nr:ATP synthase subunit b [Marinobacterium sp. xm-g-48]NRP16666.1 ATP synthase subunit b [Marinobacterium sp. xm-a-152]NRP28559.1 ATP synthase subunit b [Marinobacterium sp. xm-d-420]NRP36642.1 ATP synthase subunit b [Marinobacterium sp. xm-d-579]NRP38726.1 ATP synthase subunit b [Marinobacterium sp. xm-a-121]NRP46518.1 ATP synthase subunit b [Marinobacterium sp. xm-d-543]NRP52279.1 ATP synthase subunit b [Marinobacterium sp. xm-v-242]NRP58309.1 ATP synthase subunit b [Marinobacterium sp. xm